MADRHTHYVAAFPARAPLPDGRQLAVCHTYVTTDEVVKPEAEPTCWGCKAWVEGLELPRRSRLTRHDQLQALADSGCDTWEEARGER